MDSYKRDKMASVDKAIDASMSNALRVPSKHQRDDRLPRPEPADHPHHFLHLYDSVWVCKKCDELRWMPTSVQEAWDFDAALSRHKKYDSAVKAIIGGSDVECIIELMEGVR